jgi:Raf kinase inhibitor-like YbhB/YbcL family protein
MKTLALLSCSTALVLTASVSFAAMSLTSSVVKNGQRLPFKYGYCQPNGKGEVKLSNDLTPPLTWTGAPAGTKSFVVMLVDPTASSSPNFDVKGTMVPVKKDRMKVYQWTDANIPASMTHFPEGAGSKGFVIGGKKTGSTAYGLMGINIYTEAFSSPYAGRITFPPATTKTIKGTYGRYDGPCAPWNDSVVHQYTFYVYAMNVAHLKLPKNGMYQGAALMKAMKGHILGEASLLTPYATNPKYLKS